MSVCVCGVCEYMCVCGLCVICLCVWCLCWKAVVCEYTRVYVCGVRVAFVVSEYVCLV